MRAGAEGEVTDGAAGAGDAPIGRDLRERAQHEGALGKGGMGNEKAAAGEAPSRPQDDVEIEHAWSPAAAGAPAEAALDALERPQQRGRIKVGAQDERGVGEAAAGRAERVGAVDG